MVDLVQANTSQRLINSKDEEEQTNQKHTSRTCHTSRTKRQGLRIVSQKKEMRTDNKKEISLKTLAMMMCGKDPTATCLKSSQN